MSATTQTSNRRSNKVRPISAKRISTARAQVVEWFQERNWKPFRFQRQAWNAYLAGESGLIHASTGTGKTLAAWMGPIIEALAEQPEAACNGQPTKRRNTSKMRILWLSPLRALAADTLGSLTQPVTDLGLPWSVETRTGDTSSKVRNRQRSRLPTVLVTTPESLSLLLTRPDSHEQLSDLRLVVVDEWHELLSTKRGTQTELCLARLRSLNSNLRTWGLSATLGNTEQALETLLGLEGDSTRTLITGVSSKKVVVDSLIPETMERFPWAGHLGLKNIDRVVEGLESSNSSLVFTNTRSQTEAWYQAILQARPQWAGQIALHHGSLDRSTRDWVEDGLRAGSLKCVVCTSSLDLGVDFHPVERVFQVGSPKGVARLLQRAGRSGHSPGRASRVTCVPTNAFELVEVAAARDAIESGDLEGREPISNPLDVLSQHAVTLAVGGGFHEKELLREVKTAYSYRNLTDEQWNWILYYITSGGTALQAYPDYRKVTEHNDGTFRVDDRRIAMRHRLSVGTIVSDASLTVQFMKGPKLGTIEEAFLAKINVGDQFFFAGRFVELVQIQDSKVYVRKAKPTRSAKIPRWMGGRMPLSTELAAAVRDKLHDATNGIFESAEMQAVRPLLELQNYWSRVPRHGELLIERVKTREGHHIYFYPFAGRLVHEGLSSLFAYRMSQLEPITFSISINDYGFELLSATPAPFEAAINDGLLDSDGIEQDIANCVNAAEMGKRQFREIANIAGLVFNGYPGNRKTARQVQASTGLLYDVFQNYDPENLLLQQAHQEVLERQLERQRMLETLAQMRTSEILIRDLQRFSPMSFPLMVSRLRERLSSEKLADRVRRMQESLEKAAGTPESIA